MGNFYSIVIRVLSIFDRIYSYIQAKSSPVAYARRIGVTVGEGVQMFGLQSGAFGSEPYLISIGDNAVITAGVRFVVHDGSTFLFRNEYPDLDVMGPISIGNNTFIGTGSIILPGVVIGENCVIGAMSVVTKSIPDGSVVAGNPARIVQKTDELLAKMLVRTAGTGSLSPKFKRQQLMQCERMLDDRNRMWLISQKK